MVGHTAWPWYNLRSSGIVHFVQGGVVKTFRCATRITNLLEHVLVSEDQFRRSIVVLLAIAVTAFVVLGYRFTENGRYQQYDFQQDHVIFGNSMENPTPKAFDTRTGTAKPSP